MFEEFPQFMTKWQMSSPKLPYNLQGGQYVGQVAGERTSQQVTETAVTAVLASEPDIGCWSSKGVSCNGCEQWHHEGLQKNHSVAQVGHCF